MRAAHAIWRFLSHPALSVAGNLWSLFTIGPLVVAVLVAVAGRILDQPVLFLVALGVALLGLAVALINAVGQRSSTGGSSIPSLEGALQFGPVEVGKPRSVEESNVFVESWNGAPIVFNLLNPQGSPRARDVRPTVEVKDLDGNVIAGPANARWANPQPPNREEVERDIPANGAPVAIDTVIQEVGGDKFWLVTDENLRVGLKANTKAITETSFEVIVTVQGENVPPISKAVGVSLGFPLPVIRSTAKAQRRASEPVPNGGRIYGGAAISQAISEMGAREDRESIVAEFVTMIEEGKKLCEGEFVGDPPWLHYGHWRKGILDFVGSVLGDAERQRLLEVEPAGSMPRDHIVPVMDWLRERRDNPDSWTPKLWSDDLAAAISKRYETQRDAGSNGNATQHQPSESLAVRLDSMMREGMGLVTEFSVSVQPEKKNGVWKVSGGDAPKEWWDQAADFQQRIRDLLQAEHPALLTDFRDGCNSHLQKEREARERRKQDASPDSRSAPDKMLDLASHERSGPRREVEAFLEGLATARKSI